MYQQMPMDALNFEDASSRLCRGAELPVGPSAGHFGLVMFHNQPQTMMPSQNEIFSPPSLPQTPFQNHGFNFLPEFNFMNFNLSSFAPSEGIGEINPVFFQTFMENSSSGMPSRDFKHFPFKSEHENSMVAASRAPGRKPYIDPNLSDDERERREKRRQRNKEAAARCRQRRLDLITSLTTTVDSERKANIKKERDIQLLRKKIAEMVHMLSGMKDRLLESERAIVDRVLDDVQNNVIYQFKTETDSLIKLESQDSPINLTLPKVEKIDLEDVTRPNLLDLSKQSDLFRMPMASFGSLPSITNGYGFNPSPMMFGMSNALTQNSASSTRVICEL